MRIGEIFGQLDVRCLNLVYFYKASGATFRTLAVVLITTGRFLWWLVQSHCLAAAVYIYFTSSCRN